MTRRMLAAAAALTLGLGAGAAARADTLLDFVGPTAHLASPDFVLFFIDAGAGDASAAFTIDGFNTLDGVVGNNLEDDFTLTLNGVDILRGTWDLGGGGASQVFFAPAGATFAHTARDIGQGGTLSVTTPLALQGGLNILRFAFSSQVPEGIANESWDLRDLRVSGAPEGSGGSGAPEPAVWISLLMGFFGMGDTLRRSRRRPAPIPL